ncbi:ABC transporter permease [Streptomyces sp. S.PNR 29]|uniref:ABC transporter permease n=1 Tax=Streptomyces sp. S.PNR 29 TaxID=2973805 RepID=UPI0025AF42FB|nr:ABC transporter permease [Streptomyces sp. S.PNR 29]MDN0194302.1 ABC transporter permease [Streptomyces sp. S.PNR 29]
MTAPTVLAPTAAPRQVRWLLRLHRPALYAWTGLVLATGAALLWLRDPLTDAAADAWQQYNSCAFNGPCLYDQDAILLYKDVYTYTTIAVLAVPFLAAAWAGAALTGRELETGTARLAWTQGVSPARWLAAGLTVPAALVTAGTAVLVLLHHLAWAAGEGRIDTHKGWSDVPTFYAGGPVTVALALTGLLAGALAGLLLARTLAALAAAVVAVAGLWTAVLSALPHLWPSVTRVTALRDGVFSGPGITVDEGLVTSTGAHVSRPSCGSTAECGDLGDLGDLYVRLDAVGHYRDYHPRSHYWPLQLVGTGVLIAVAVLLAVAAFHLLRRRTAAQGREGAAV